ncbi:DUF2653 family protein [Ferviditalea candida]|uniref:DUF2653 family protein n=1 Tax=Ferviditalea candida TaxID=3108399 RepID=A0ABU5ZLK5_9BACL|nr:DUF2653 family protein [Paenibacillaceae bacterium T2]
MILDEQEITNAICLHQAERRGIRPQEVSVELLWDEDLGFSASVEIGGREMYLVESNMLEAIERYLLNKYGHRVFRNQIRLELDEQIRAEIDDSAL